MLLGDFFLLRSLQTDGKTIRASLLLNPKHRIFDGHFPGRPVVPGVCMMQIIKELLEQVLAKHTRLKKADHLKFLALIVPTEVQELQAELSYEWEENQQLDLTARLYREGTTYFKCRCVFAPDSD
jgi:3-hydroxyacyl-[acyl-carrier-protein] dehydratase